MNAVIDVLCDSVANKRHILSTGPDLLIEFNASSNTTAKGFRGKFKFIQNDIMMKHVDGNTATDSSIVVGDIHSTLKKNNNNIMAFQTMENTKVFKEHKGNCREIYDSRWNKTGVFETNQMFTTNVRLSNVNNIVPFQNTGRVECVYEFYASVDERVQIKFLDFNIPTEHKNTSECKPNDSLQLLTQVKGKYEAVELYCGAFLPKPIMSKGPKLMLQFMGKYPSTQQKMGYYGFKAEYKFLTNYGITTGFQLDHNCSFEYNSTSKKSGFFTSPNFPGLYPQNMACHYYFYGEFEEKVKINFSFFDVEGIDSLYGNLTKRCATASVRSATAPTTAAAVAKNTQIREYHEVTGDVLCPSQVMGIDHIRDPRLNKGLAFTLEERQVLGIHGLQPARFKTQEEQLELCKIAVNRYTESLNKYLYLSDLHDRNERLFFRFLSENIEEMMPIVYTPTVGLACQRFGLIYRRPRGLFVTINDRGHVYDIIKNWPEPDVRAIVVTDGERILGLGDLGASGMGIPVGKLALYTALAGIKPHQCLPILIDVGTNNIDLLEDPLYVGLRQKRVVGREYDDFIDEFMEAVVKRYGQNTLIQFEDFGNHNAFRFLDKYRNTYCTFNDDIQGTAAVAVAGLYASKRITGKSFADYTFLFAGAGEAAIGIADLVVKAMIDEGIEPDVARSKIWMVDINGLLTTTRKEGNLDGHKVSYAKDVEPMTNLEDIVEKVKPNVLIGASAAAGIFTPKILKTMGANNERPVVFALSNPTSKAECTAEQAYQNTDGRVIFSSGSPFPPVTINGKTYSPGQGNNAYIFPGVALGVIATLTHHIPDDMFLIAAKELANSVEQSDLDRGSLYPPLSAIREISMRIAMGVTKCAYDSGLASTYPEPEDKRKWLEEQVYNFNYESSMPVTWEWPRMPYVKTRYLNPTKLFGQAKDAKK